MHILDLLLSEYIEKRRIFKQSELLQVLASVITASKKKTTIFTPQVSYYHLRDTIQVRIGDDEMNFNLKAKTGEKCVKTPWSKVINIALNVPFVSIAYV